MYNYRPISLLPFFSKVFERCIKDRLLSFLLKYQLISSDQFGFRPKHSTSDALVGIMCDVQSALNNNSKCASIFLDYKKAFDTINHRILLMKLYNIGFRGPVIKLIENYLSNRSVVTKINDTSSDNIIMNIGVPQGSILGPLLFLVYINDFPSSIKPYHSKIFADETTVNIISSSFQSLKTSIISCLNLISDWVTKNCLSLNTSKTKFMIYRSNEKFNITFENEDLEQVHSFKLLGVHIDYRFKFDVHCDYLYKKLVKFLPIFYSIQNKLNAPSKLLIYYSFIQSSLQYGLITFGHTVKSSKNKKLQILQNKLIKCLFNIPRLTSAAIIYEFTGIYDVNKLYVNNIVSFCLKMKSRDPALPEMYQVLHTKHCSGLSRHAGKYKIPFSKFPKEDMLQSMFLKWNLA